jgi:hypothetical protein
VGRTTRLLPLREALMHDTSGCTDVSGLVARRKAIGFSTVASQGLASIAVASAMSLAATGVSVFAGWTPPLELYVLVTIGAAWATVRVIRRLRWGDRRVAWACLALTFVFLATVMVGLPLQEAGTVQSAILADVMGFHAGFGEGIAANLVGLALVGTGPVVFVAADSWILRKYPRSLWRWLALAVLAVVTFGLIGVALKAISDLVPPWTLTVLLVDLPLAVVLLPGVLLVLTDRTTVVDGVQLPAAAELAIPASARRAINGRWNAAATVLQVISVVLAFVALLQVAASRNAQSAEQAGQGAARWLFGVGLAVAAVAVGRAARAQAMPTADEALAHDRRPFVLYLRSFRDDDIRIRTRRTPRRSVLDNLVSIPLRVIFIRMRERFEEVLVWQLWWHGPVVAVGDPVRRRYRLGSPRLYLPDERWRLEVQRMIQSARFVVVVLGRTEGLAWELQCLARLNATGKLLLVLPPAAEPERRMRGHAFGEIATRAGLPQLPPDSVDAGLAAVLSPDGTGWRTFCGRNRDEWSYEVALETAVMILHSSTQVTAGPAHTGA